MEKNKKNKTDTTVSSRDEDKEEEIVKETALTEFECPMCKKMLELKTNWKYKGREVANVLVCH